jgi:4-hydroxybenzoate polyprenyltransferase
MTADPQAAVRPRIPLRAALSALRPSQWTKNSVVLAAFVFAFWDRDQAVGLSGLLGVIPAAAFFCVVSSGIYILNDIHDIEADRRHPFKRRRAIASGRLPLPAAWPLGGALLAFGLAAAFVLSVPLGVVLLAYVLIQAAYTLWLKHVALLDVFVIAAGFVLRALAGAVVLGVLISPWLLLCTFVLALFLALCKRREEKRQGDETVSEQRASLAAYDSRLLDQLIVICAAATIVCYALYTLWPETVDKFGTHALGFTVPFVVFGVFRYMDLAYRHSKGERPEKVLLTDIPLIVTILLYGLTVLAIFALHV